MYLYTELFIETIGVSLSITKGRRGRDRMVVGITTNCAII